MNAREVDAKLSVMNFTDLKTVIEVIADGKPYAVEKIEKIYSSGNEITEFAGWIDESPCFHADTPDEVISKMQHYLEVSCGTE